MTRAALVSCFDLWPLECRNLELGRGLALMGPLNTERLHVQTDPKAIKGESYACGEYLEAINPSSYVTYAITRPRFVQTMSNILEVGDSCILPIRSYAPLRMCIQLYLYIME
ncbi:hypothetical protein R1flu_025575 [Riccia fluitans]|uniref:Uncharacterized protein n=1 Tax=Riccia fluitans TaxID=41844 RepID=A0ABD1XY52_9MARC